MQRHEEEISRECSGLEHEYVYELDKIYKHVEHELERVSWRILAWIKPSGRNEDGSIDNVKCHIVSLKNMTSVAKYSCYDRGARGGN